MLSSLISKVKKIVSSIEIKKLKELKVKILNCKKTSEVKELLNDYLLGVI